jgi:hypothetical protein
MEDFALKTIVRGNPLRLLAVAVPVVAASFVAPHPVHAESPRVIALQGVLANGAGVPKPNGGYSVTFRLFSAPAGGTALWTETAKPVTVAGGRGAFSTSLGTPTAFGALVFDKPYFLEAQVSPDPPMMPRIPLQSVPYALNAWSVDGNAGTSPAAQFLGTSDNQPLVMKTNGHRALRLQDVLKPGGAVRSVNILGGFESNFMDAAVVGGTISGGGATGSINDLRGDFGVIGGGAGNFLDAYAYAVIAGGTGNIAQGTGAAIGGGSGNNVQAEYSVIAGGSQNYVAGANSFLGGGLNNGVAGAYAGTASGSNNQANGSSSFVGGGNQNATGSAYAFVGGGENNAARATYAAVGGGSANVASGGAAVIAGGVANKAVGGTSTVGGGAANTAGSDATSDATVAGGQGNEATGEDSAVGGGWLNSAAGRQSVVAGGYQNIAGGALSTVGGGWKNSATGYEATVPGGYYNGAYGTASLAAGYRAVASHAGTFVWSDTSADVDFASSAANQFAIRAAGGMVLETGHDAYIYTGTGAAELNRYLLLLNSQGRPSASGLKTGGILCADDYAYFSPGKNDMVVKGRVSVGYNFVPQNYTMSVNGNIYALNGYASSDARYKREVETLDDALGSVLRLRGVSFEWDRENRPEHNFPAGRQLGFIAQEVQTVLPEVVSTDDAGYKAVSYQSIVPVLVEAVKALKAGNDRQSAEITALREQNAAMEARLRRVEESLGGRSAARHR